MKVFGVPWEDVREAGRLDRLYDAAIEEKRRFERERARQDRGGPILRAALWCFLHTFDLVRWGGVLYLVAVAVVPRLPEPFDKANAIPLTPLSFAIAIACSLPLWRAQRAWDLDQFLCIRVPSREALLLSRWIRMLPSLLVAGCAWATYLAASWMPAFGGDPWAIALLVAAVLPAPLMVVQSAMFGAVSEPRLDGEMGVLETVAAWSGWGLVVCLGFTVVATASSEPEAEARNMLRRFSGIALAFTVLLPLVLGLALHRVLPGGRWRWVGVLAGIGRAAPGGVWALALLGAFLVPPWQAGKLTGLGLAHAGALFAVTAIALPLRLHSRLRAARELWPEIAWGRGKRRASTDSAPARRMMKEPAGYDRPVPGLMWAHVRSATRRLGFGMLVLGVFFVVLLVKGLLARSGEGFGYLAFVGLYAPRWFDIDHRVRAWLLGMDLREQVAHDLRALFWGAGVPVLAIATVITALQESPEPSRIAFLGAVLLLRAGQRGLATIAGMDNLSYFLSGISVLLCAVFLLPGLAQSWPPAPLAMAGLLAVAGFVGLVRARRVFTEERLLDEMRSAA